MKKVSDLVDAFNALKNTNSIFASYKLCNHRISNLKYYIEEHCTGCNNYRLVIMNQLNEAQSAIPDWMLLNDFFQANLQLYGNLTNSQYASCYNLSKDVSIRMPSITIQSLTQCNSPCLAGQFHDVLFVGKRDAFLGVILYNGVILLYRETLLKLLNYEKEFFDVMNLIMNRIQLINSILYGGSVSGVDKFLTDLSVTNIYTENRDKIIKTIIKSGGVNDDNVRKMFSTFENSIFKNYVEPLIKSSIFGATNLYSYSNLLKQMRDAYEEKIAVATQNGYKSGLARSSVFLNRGYTPRLIDGAVHWSKKISIFPEVAIIQNVSFKIPEISYFKKPRNEVYYITELTIHPDGTVNAIGRHPNVAASGTVCLGDLKEKSYHMKNMTNEDLADYIDRVESLLENVNFDSAYFGFDKDFSKDQFVELASGASRYVMRKKLKSAEIRDAVFTDDDGIEDDEDENEDSSSEENEFDAAAVKAQFETSRMEVPNANSAN